MQTHEIDDETMKQRIAKDGEFIRTDLVITDQKMAMNDTPIQKDAATIVGQCVHNGQLMNAMSDGSLGLAIPDEIQRAADRDEAYHDQYVRDLSGSENVHGTPFEDRFPSSILDAQTPSEIDTAIQLLGSLQTIRADVKRQMIEELKSRRANFELGKEIGREQASSDAFAAYTQSLQDAWRT